MSVSSALLLERLTIRSRNLSPGPRPVRDEAPVGRDGDLLADNEDGGEGVERPGSRLDLGVAAREGVRTGCQAVRLAHADEVGGAAELLEGERCSVIVAAGEGPVRVGRDRAGTAGLVGGVGLLVPVPVVEVLVLVGDLVAVEPVDREAQGGGGVGGAGVVAGVDGGGAADDGEPGAVLLDGVVAGGGGGLDVVVVVGDVGGGGVAGGGGGEQQAEAVAGAQPVGDEGPVGGDMGIVVAGDGLEDGGEGVEAAELGHIFVLSSLERIAAVRVQ